MDQVLERIAAWEAAGLVCAAGSAIQNRNRRSPHPWLRPSRYEAVGRSARCHDEFERLLDLWIAQ
jgi:hypothetical protein